MTQPADQQTTAASRATRAAAPAAIDPVVGAMLEQLTAQGMNGTTSEHMPVDQLREQTRALLTAATAQLPPVEVGEVTDLTVPGADGELAARLYRPAGTGAADGLPTLVFLHGGGFVICDLDTHDTVCRLLCRDAGVVVVSVAYRLAPEHPFPDPVDDVLAACRWALAHVGELGRDPARVAVGGDSAGGNLAAVAAQVLRDEGTPLAAQLLIYPAVDMDPESHYPSLEENAEGYMLTAGDIEFFHRQYVPEGADVGDPRLSPLRGRLEGLPPAIVATAGFDPLRDQGSAYATALEGAGVAVTLREHPSLIHGFANFAVMLPSATAAMESLARDLRGLLSQAG